MPNIVSLSLCSALFLNPPSILVVPVVVLSINIIITIEHRQNIRSIAHIHNMHLATHQTSPSNLQNALKTEAKVISPSPISDEKRNRLFGDVACCLPFVQYCT